MCVYIYIFIYLHLYESMIIIMSANMGESVCASHCCITTLEVIGLGKR
jgi:hypothetical protein